MNIFLTGGTGSFGYKFLERVKQQQLYGDYSIEKVYVYSRDEKKQYDLREKYSGWNYLKSIIGDVRDRNRLEQIFPKDVDVVINAAALKHVPQCEECPIEAIKTNVLGAHNLIEVAKKFKVGKYLAISSDKACLDYHSRVELSDGTTKSIAEIVKGKLQVKVKTMLPDGSVGVSKVVGWYKNKLKERRMYNIDYENSYRHRGYQKGVVVTEDHPILTTKGWKEASELTEKDLLVTKDLKPNRKQIEVLYGTLLGDAGIVGETIRFYHCAKQREWLQLKNSIFKNLGSSDIKKVNKKSKKYNKTYSGYTFSLYTSPFHKKLKNKFYTGNIKIFPKELKKEDFTPLLLATWYMDDGCLADKRINLARIATHNFKIEEVKNISSLLNSIGLECYVYSVRLYGKIYPELRFTVVGSRKLYNIISPYIINSMRYKIPKNLTPYDPSLWFLGEPDQYTSKPIIKIFKRRKRAKDLPLPWENKNKKICKRGHELSNDNVYITSTGSRQCKLCIKENKKETKDCYDSKDVYCLDVENTHNFIVNGVVVHNCLPINSYGITKALQEKLTISSNAKDRPTSFSCVRYGNVMNSRGSVIPLFMIRAKVGQTIPITDERMTRFLMSLDDAVDLVLFALDQMKGGEIFIHKAKSCNIVDLAKAIIKEYGAYNDIEYIGIRPGEKIHEELISEGESLATKEIDDTYSVIYPLCKKPINEKVYSYSSDKYTVTDMDKIIEILEGVLYEKRHKFKIQFS